MPCDTVASRGQTLQERVEEVRRAIAALSEGLTSGRVKAKVGPQGAITFVGLSDRDRNGVTDACAYRRLMVSGSALAKAQIAKAEQLAGRTVDRRVVAAGTHSHDGGTTWHGKG